MMDKDAKELVSEIKKIRGDMDKVQAFVKTVAEQVTIIATNTTPAEASSDEEPPAVGD